MEGLFSHNVRQKGGLEPFGNDYQQGTTAGATENSLYLRLPGQWDDGTWDDATSGAGVYYNVNRWLEAQTGRYTRADPIVTKTSYPYSYVDAMPTRFIDPLGLLKVPCSDCEDLEGAEQNAKRRIHLLVTTGSAVDPSPGASNVVSAITVCGGSGSWGDPQTYRSGPDTFYDEPCIFLCTGVHERVHRTMCHELGFDSYSALTEAQQELPGYQEELRCLKAARSQGHLELTRSGVSYPGSRQ